MAVVMRQQDEQFDVVKALIWFAVGSLVAMVLTLWLMGMAS
jgi:hypothetical protein